MHFYRYFILVFLLLIAVVTAHANILDIEDGEATLTGIYIKDLVTDSVLVDHNSAFALTPASITKCVTTATAMSILGPDFHFTTTVELTGERLNRRRWNGNLVIRASGDPTLESDEFMAYKGFTDSIARALQRLGVDEIAGNIIVADEFKDSGPVPNWECEDIAWPYGAGIYGFNYSGNCVKAYPNRGTTEPATDMKIDCRVSDNGTDVLRGINSSDLTVWTSEENRRKRAWSINVTVPDPSAMYVKLLTAKLRAAGIKVDCRNVSADSASTVIYRHRSPSAREICLSLMKRSDNLFAEGMFRALVPGGSRSDCMKTEHRFLDTIGLNPKQTTLLDGSGLTRANRFSPAFIGGLLEYMAENPFADDYISFFPLSGKEGTLKRFLAKTPLEGLMALKTGSVRSVQTYAGYKLDADGKPTHVVVVMVNGFFCKRAVLRKQVEKFLLQTFEIQ